MVTGGHVFVIQPLMPVGGNTGQSLLVEWQNMAAVHHSVAICEKLCYVTICLCMLLCNDSVAVPSTFQKIGAAGKTVNTNEYKETKNKATGKSHGN